MVSHLGSLFIPLRSSRQSCPVPCFILYSPTSFLSSRHRHTYVYMTFPFRSLQGISNLTCLKQNLVFLLKLASSYIPSPVLLHLVNCVIIHKLLLPKLGAIFEPSFSHIPHHTQAINRSPPSQSKLFDISTMAFQFIFYSCSFIICFQHGSQGELFKT